MVMIFGDKREGILLVKGISFEGSVNLEGSQTVLEEL